MDSSFASTTCNCTPIHLHLQNIGKQAHAIKGSSANLGLISLTAAAGAIEQAAKLDAPVPTALRHALAFEFSRLLAYVRACLLLSTDATDAPQERWLSIVASIDATHTVRWECSATQLEWLDAEFQANCATVDRWAA